MLDVIANIFFKYILKSIAIIQGKVEQESRKVKLESSRESLARIFKGKFSKNLKGKVKQES